MNIEELVIILIECNAEGIFTNDIIQFCRGQGICQNNDELTNKIVEFLLKLKENGYVNVEKQNKDYLWKPNTNGKFISSEVLRTYENNKCKDTTTNTKGVNSEVTSFDNLPELKNKTIYWSCDKEECFKVIENKDEVHIKKYLGKIENLIIPSEIKGKKVTRILENAFADCLLLKNIRLSNNIISIDSGTGYWSGAFYKCYNLENVILGEKTAKIDHNAFAECYSLKRVFTGRGLISIENYAFNKCRSLICIYTNANIKNIGDDVFRDCPKDMTFYGEMNTYLETYCIKKDMKHKAIISD